MSVPNPGVRGIHVNFSLPMLIVLGVIVVAPWLGVLWIAGKSASVPAILSTASASTNSSATARSGAVTGNHAADNHSAESQLPTYKPDRAEIISGRTGPWGVIDIIPMTIELPDEYLFVPSDSAPVKWYFKDFTKDQAVAFLRESGVDAKGLDELVKANWNITSDGASVEPGDNVILSLTQEARSRVYQHLIKFEENAHTVDPFWFRPGRVDFRLNGSGLSDESVALLKKLLYPHGDNMLLFADMEPALRQIKDPEERKRFVKAVSRKKSVFVRLHLDSESNVAQLADYWGHDGRQKDLIPIMNAVRYNAMRGIEDNPKLNVLSLLPPFARERLYNHAYSATTQGMVKEDCFWSALNFFAIEPDNRINDMAYTGEVLRRDYYSITEPSRLGDLILLTRPNGEAVHAAAYVADDIVFTKNGEAHTQPWILMHMDDMLDTYRIKDPDLTMRCFRKKGS